MYIRNSFKLCVSANHIFYLRQLKQWNSRGDISLFYLSSIFSSILRGISMLYLNKVNTCRCRDRLPSGCWLIVFTGVLSKPMAAERGQLWIANALSAGCSSGYYSSCYLLGRGSRVVRSRLIHAWKSHASLSGWRLTILIASNGTHAVTHSSELPSIITM